ncbi:MAG: LacI family DNA-binding transcriptional regulator [Alphaproteobacteria bacterium]|nr:LacI family DNA-binding transcriptional regulator [Alphaproteobacteria bacterium]
MGRIRVRLKDVAEATGYSVNTVSLVLRGSSRLPLKTRDLILKEAERQNYVPNQLARSLILQSTKMVGLVLTDIMNPTITKTARSIELDLAKAGYGVMFASSDNELANEKRALNHLQSSQVDGILIYPTNRNEISHIQNIAKSGYPILMLSDIPDAGLDVVAIDDIKGAHIAVSHLIEQGHKQIAILDGAKNLGNSDKYDGSFAAAEDAGLPSSALQIVDPEGHGAINGFAAMQKAWALTPRPTAIFASTDSLAIGAARWCREHDLRIPQDVAIVGFDNTEAAEFCSTPLTTINYDSEDVSKHAVERIISRIESDNMSDDTTITLIEPNLVIRESS